MTPTLRALVGENLSSCELFVDYDGTLAPIVDDPERAFPSPGAAAALVSLRALGCRVSVMSGRPVGFLETMLGETDAMLIGLYGLEQIVDGAITVDDEAAAWKEVVVDVAAAAVARGPRGMGIENKGVSLTLHYRTHEDLEDEVVEWARNEALRTGLSARSARRSMELHPPVAVDKGSALLRHFHATSSVVVYIGDDEGDLPAYDALDELADRGVRVLRVAVSSDEVPEELRRRADVVLDDTNAVVPFLTP